MSRGRPGCGAVEARPRSRRASVGVPVLGHSCKCVPRPPEVEVVLVVPAVDRRVRSAEVLQCEEPCALGSVEVGSCDELPGDFVPALDGRTLPPPGDVGLLGGPGRAGGPAEALTSLNSVAHCWLSSAGGGAERNCEEFSDEERPHTSDPRRRVESCAPVLERSGCQCPGAGFGTHGDGPNRPSSSLAWSMSGPLRVLSRCPAARTRRRRSHRAKPRMRRRAWSKVPRVRETEPSPEPSRRDVIARHRRPLRPRRRSRPSHRYDGS